jgi:hypothetical protein
MADMKQVPSWRTWTIRCHHTKFSSPGDLASLVWAIKMCSKIFLLFEHILSFKVTNSKAYLALLVPLTTQKIPSPCDYIIDGRKWKRHRREVNYINEMVLIPNLMQIYEIMRTLLMETNTPTEWVWNTVRYSCHRKHTTPRRTASFRIKKKLYWHS